MPTCAGWHCGAVYGARRKVSILLNTIDLVKISKRAVSLTNASNARSQAK